MTGSAGQRVAVVTGSAQNIGRAEALALARRGFRVAVTAWSHLDEAKRTAQDLREAGCSQAEAFTVDVTDPAAVRRFREQVEQEFGRVDLLVNNAGGASPWVGHLLSETSDDAWRSLVDTNLSSCFFSMREFAPTIAASGGGLIVNTSSIYALTGGAPGWAPYTAVKAGIIGLTKGAARDFAPQGVMVACIVPGVVRTTRTEANLGADLLDRAARQSPARRLTDADDIGATVAALADAPALALNGSVIDVSGGRADYWFGEDG